MSGLFGGGGGSAPAVQMQAQTPQYQAQTVDMSSANAAMFERIRRASAYGKKQTMLSDSSMDLATPGAMRKSFLGATT